MLSFSSGVLPAALLLLPLTFQASPTHARSLAAQTVLRGSSSWPVEVAEAASVPASLTIDEDSDEVSEMLRLHRNLVQIESISGNEHDVGNYVADYLSSRGFKIIRQNVSQFSENPVDKQRFNVYAYTGEDGPASKVLVSSHIDTVPPFYNYSLKHDGDEIWGRGSVDAKGSVAAQIAAALSLYDTGEVQAGDVSLLFVVGEETIGDGMKTANKLGLTWQAGIFGEPTELKLATGHKGILGGTMRARGKSAHSGYPWLGVNANSRLIRAMAIFDKLELESSERYGNTTINIGRIRAGVASNVISEYAEAGFALRLAAGTPAEVEKKIVEAIDDDQIEFEWGTGYAPVDCDTDVDGFDTISVNYGTDVPNLERDRLNKRYLYGPGSIFVAHGDHEHLTKDDLKEALEGYKRLIKHALQI